MFANNNIKLLLLTSLVLSLTACGGGAAGTKSDGYQPYPLQTKNHYESLVRQQNRYRAEVGVRSLKWSPTLAKQAQAWANHLRDNNGCAMIHSKAGSQRSQHIGENLFLAIQWQPKKITRGLVKSNAAAVDWYREKGFYNPQNGKCQGGVCGHYTQMVWRNTKQVGCGVARCIKQKDNMWYSREIWVCRYSPIGNWPNRRAY